ncbi:MAG: coenzyme F420-0:L-glutamate ligase [Candidatus Bathyarchaeia archaeon]
MPKYKACATKYWRPGEDYEREMITSLKGKVSDGDFVVISEKAISTALNNIVDESFIKPSLTAKIIARWWMPIVWGYILGPLCHLRRETILRLRRYPYEMGSRHKQVALQRAGFLQALLFCSEGGIDGSNLPYSYVSLPLRNADAVARKIQKRILLELGVKVTVLIVDTDKTFSFGGFHFTSRPKPIKGIHSFGGVLAYVIGRMFKLKKRATPIAVAGSKLSVEQALTIADFANRVRGSGAGRTIWDMAETFKVSLTDVSWEMLEKVKHTPIVLIRIKNCKPFSE